MAPPETGDPVLRASDALATYFVGDSTMGEALTTICESAVDAIPHAVMTGVSMTVDARVGTYVFTHPEVVEIDRAQYESCDGPCVDAFASGEPVIIHSTLGDGPYPEFRAVAARHGMLGVMALPLNTGVETVGALNVYAEVADAFDPQTVEAGGSFSTRAAYLLLNHQAYWDARSLGENLQQAMSSRAQIEQAKGIVMATTGLTADEAFHRLRQQSQYENVKLRDIARELIRGVGQAQPDRDRPDRSPPGEN